MSRLHRSQTLNFWLHAAARLRAGRRVFGLDRGRMPAVSSEYPEDEDGELDVGAYWRQQHALPIHRRSSHWWIAEAGSTAAMLGVALIVLVVFPVQIAGWYGLLGLLVWGYGLRYGLRDIGLLGPEQLDEQHQ